MAARSFMGSMLLPPTLMPRKSATYTFVVPGLSPLRAVMSFPSASFLGRARRDHADRGLQAARAGLGLFGAFEGLDVLAAVGEAELLPAVPRRRRALQSLDEILRRRDVANVFVELELHTERFVTLQTGCFAVALAKGNAERA